MRMVYDGVIKSICLGKQHGIIQSCNDPEKKAPFYFSDQRVLTPDGRKIEIGKRGNIIPRVGMRVKLVLYKDRSNKFSEREDVPMVDMWAVSAIPISQGPKSVAEQACSQPQCDESLAGVIVLKEQESAPVAAKASTGKSTTMGQGPTPGEVVRVSVADLMAGAIIPKKGESDEKGEPYEDPMYKALGRYSHFMYGINAEPIPGMPVRDAYYVQRTQSANQKIASQQKGGMQLGVTSAGKTGKIPVSG